MPRLLIESIGAGGGSIIWIDESSQTMRVGPESAGAVPGPACYGRGGTRPTTSDANVVLGRYNPENFLGGQMTLDAAAAETALATVARPMRMSEVQAAAGAVRIIESQMADLMRQMTLEQGLDPRDFVIYAYGGAGGAHAAQFARELGCQQVIVPLGDLASTWSALGVMSSDVLNVYEKAQLMTSPFEADALNAVFADLEARARRQLAAEGFTGRQVEIRRFADMKFTLQIHQVEVPVPDGRITSRQAAAQVSRFIERYEQIYGEGSAFTGAGVQAGVFRVLARGKVRTPSLVKRAGRAGAAHPMGTRQVYWEGHGFQATPIHDSTTLSPGATVRGPAIVELPETTIVVPPGDTGKMDPYGSFVITIGRGAR
jgi:N-methylhydantoinase A